MASIGFALMAAWLLTACDGVGSAANEDERRHAAGLAGMSFEVLDQAARYGLGSGMVMRGGRIVCSWGSMEKHYELQASTMSIGAIALGLSLGEGILGLDDRVIDRYPDFGRWPTESRNRGWAESITFRHLASHTAGFDRPGGFEPLMFEPGSAWAYSDGATDWIADALTFLYQADLKELLFERVLNPLEIGPSDLMWRGNPYPEKNAGGIQRREFGSGISANVKAMVRIGELFLREGNWKGRQLIPKDFIRELRKPVATGDKLSVKNDRKSEFAGAPKHYGLLWWNNADGALKGVPKDAFWAWGGNDSLIAVIPSLDLVAARAGEMWRGERSPSYYAVLEPFLSALSASINHGAPYANSPAIAAMVWEDAATIVRSGFGSDNWPVTWGGDDLLYTAFGDGFGFDPKNKKKLSLGFAKIEGFPPTLSGNNIRSNGEQLGQGKTGKKASGMLMIDGVLYMWVRNANRQGEGSQLAWSLDGGVNWNWSGWLFKHFGHCTFVNYGKNYAGARDNYVYTVSHDHPSAYNRADRFVLIRAHRDGIRERAEYEFFAKLDQAGQPVWTKNIEDRGAVFKDHRRCHRSAVSYNQSLRRYLWWQAKFPEGIDGRFESKSFGVFDAPEPWGPWSTVFFTENWDVAAGESGSFPTKWMADSGKSMHLVFSGEDAFSVRKAQLFLSPSRNAGEASSPTGQYEKDYINKTFFSYSKDL